MGIFNGRVSQGNTIKQKKALHNNDKDYNSTRNHSTSVLQFTHKTKPQFCFQISSLALSIADPHVQVVILACQLFLTVPQTRKTCGICLRCVLTPAMFRSRGQAQ